MSTANYFTFIRIFISPIFLLLYMTPETFNLTPPLLPYALLFLLLVSEFSDAFDGYIARKYNEVTDFGKLFDPMADSIYRISVFLTFTLPPVSIPMWIVFVFLYRDSVVSTLRTICALKGFTLAARKSGKLKAALQGLSALLIILLMIAQTNGLITSPELTKYATWIAGFAATYAFLSGIDYIYANRHYISRILLKNAH